MSKTKKDIKSFPGEAVVKDVAEIGEIVRQLRKAGKLTQVETAAMCRVGTRFLSDLENGKPTLHLGKAMQVLRDFGLLVILRKKGLSNVRHA